MSKLDVVDIDPKWGKTRKKRRMHARRWGIENAKNRPCEMSLYEDLPFLYLE